MYEPVKGDLSFSYLNVLAHNYVAFNDFSIKQAAANVKSAVGQGYALANFRDVSLARIYETNELDSMILRQNAFALLANPVIENPVQKGEYLIINNIESKTAEPLKKRILTLSQLTDESIIGSDRAEIKNLYGELRKDDGITILTHDDVINLKRNLTLSHMNPTKEKIIEGLFFGNSAEKEIYINETRKKARGVLDVFAYEFSNNPQKSIYFILAGVMSPPGINVRNMSVDEKANILLINPNARIPQKNDYGVPFDNS